MNVKINQAMEQNKIFQVKDKFFRKGEDGTMEEMQQVKTEEIVTKGSRKFLRTIMKFIPKQIFMGSKPESVPAPANDFDSEHHSASLGHRSRSDTVHTAHRLALNGETDATPQMTQFQNKTLCAENISGNMLDGRGEDNRTSLKLNSYEMEEFVRKQMELAQKQAEGGLGEHEQYFKSAQSIYNTDRVPSKTEEDKRLQEPIEEVETDLQNEISEERREELFENLNEVYGELQENSRQIENEYQGTVNGREDTDDGSYLQMRTTMGSELPGAERVRARQFSYPNDAQVGKDEGEHEEDSAERRQAPGDEFMCDVKEDIDMFMDKEQYYADADNLSERISHAPREEPEGGQMYTNPEDHEDLFENNLENENLEGPEKNGEMYGEEPNNEYYEDEQRGSEDEGAEDNYGIYTNDREGAGFFTENPGEEEGNRQSTRNEDIPDYNAEYETQENQRTVENNIVCETGETQDKEWAPVDVAREEAANGDTLSQRTEVKIQVNQAGETREIPVQPQEPEAHEKQYHVQNSAGEGTQMKIFRIKPGQTGVIQHSFGEVSYERQIGGNNNMIVGQSYARTSNVPTRRVVAETTRVEAKPSDARVIGQAGARMDMPKMYTLNMNSFGRVEDSANASGSENRFLKFISLNQTVKGNRPMQAKPVSQPLRTVQMENQGAEEARADDPVEGFKSRVRKGKTVNVYRRDQEQSTSKKPTYIEQLGRKVKRRINTNGSETPKFSLIKWSGAEMNDQKNERNEHLKFENLDENFGSAHLSDKSETIVRIREGNSYTTTQTRGGLDELKEYIRGRRDSIERVTVEEEKMTGMGMLDIMGRKRVRSENKNWRKTVRGMEERDHWGLGKAGGSSQRRSVSRGMFKSLSGIIKSLSNYNKQIIQNSQRKRKEIQESERKVEKTRQSTEIKNKARADFEQARKSVKAPLFVEPQRASHEEMVLRNQMSFGERTVSARMPQREYQSRPNEAFRYSRHNPYGEYFENEQREANQWQRAPAQEPRNEKYNREWQGRTQRESEWARTDLRDHRRNSMGYQPARQRLSVRQSYGEYMGNEEWQGGYSQERKNSFQPSLPKKPKVFYQRANVDSRKRIRNMDEYYTTIFERANQRNRQSKFSFGNQAKAEPIYQSRRANWQGGDPNFEESRLLTEMNYEGESQMMRKESSFSGNKYMSTISMNNDQRLSTNNWDLERFTRKYAGVHGYYEEKIQSLGAYRHVDARTTPNAPRDSGRETRRTRIPQSSRNVFSQENHFESFKNNLNQFRTQTGFRNTPFTREKTIKTTPRKEPVVTRVALPSRQLINVRMDSRGKLVKVPLATKLKRKLNINHYDRLRKGKKKWTPLSYGVKGIIRLKNTSAPPVKRKR